MSLLHRPAGWRPRKWDQRVAREAERQAAIEEAFDRAHAFERSGDLEQALAWLDQARALSGGLSAEYGAQEARWARRVRTEG